MLKPIARLGLLIATVVAMGGCPDNAPVAPEDINDPSDPIVNTDLQDARATALCAADGLEDLTEVLRGYMALMEHFASRKPLPVGVTYNPATESFRIDVDFNDDGVNDHDAVGQILGTMADGWQSNETFGSWWRVADVPAFGGAELAVGGMGAHRLGLTSARLTLARVVMSVDTSVVPPDTTFAAEPTIEPPGSCEPLVVTSFQMIMSPVVRGTLPIDLSRAIPDITLEFRIAATEGKSGTLEILLIKAEGNDVGTGTATFRGKSYDIEVDFAARTATVTERT